VCPRFFAYCRRTFEIDKTGEAPLKRKLTYAEKRAKRNKKEFMTIFINGKQKRVRDRIC